MAPAQVWLFTFECMELRVGIYVHIYVRTTEKPATCHMDVGQGSIG